MTDQQQTLNEQRRRYAHDNRVRAARIRGILEASYYSDEGYEVALTDLLSDIRHFCDARKLHLDEIDASAAAHHAAEVKLALTGEEQC